MGADINIYNKKMMTEIEIKKVMDDLYARAKNEGYEEILSECNELLSRHPEYADIILRERSHIHAYQENVNEALNDRKDVISHGQAKTEDYYFAAQYLIELGFYSEAIGYLTDGLEVSKVQSTKAYISDLYLLRAFAYLQTKEYLLASHDCNSVEEDEVFVQGVGFIPKSELLRKIKSVS